MVLSWQRRLEEIGCLEQLFLLLTFYSAFFLSLALGIEGRLAAG